ncbi:MAG: UvrD-helicase domain-containing protein [Bacteroidaceae bacterium]|nr:UvrD-helicase domain-containing protein [Bacteroidaceae bacterium]
MGQQPQLLVYKASAGSGKTFTLAIQYIRQLIEDPRAYRRILAVTFTNKATTEMKERILEQLLGIARGLKGSEGYLQELVRLTGKSVEDTRKGAQEALFFILHDYSRFRIETIDSFFQSVMRNLARELELGANLSIELNNTEVLSDAVDVMLEKLDRKSPVLYWLLEYIEERISDDKRWDVSDDIKSFGRNIFEEEYVERGEELRRKLDDPKFIPQFRKELKELREMVLEQMKGFSEQFLGVLETQGLSPDDLKNGSRGIGSYFRKIARGELLNKVSNTTVQKCLESEENWTTKSSPKRQEILAVVSSDLMGILEEAEKMRPKNNWILNSCDLALKYLNNLRLLTHMDAEVRLQNQLHNRFLLSDTNALLHGLISRGDASFVYEKIGTQIDTVMIDEFQDTSRMQWENFHLLLEESLAQKEGSLIVGDIKQSIYRWRNGDWKILAGLGKDPVLRVKECTLDTNWRSEKRIIGFNNAFFPTACQLLSDRQESELGKPCEELLEAYSDVRQKPARKEEKGYVKVTLLPDSEEKAYSEAMLEALAEEVDRLMEAGVRSQDIAILVRKNKIIPTVATYFDEHTPYRIVSDEAFRLDASLAVCILMDGLRFLTAPENRIAMARLAVTFQKEVLHKDIDLNTILLNRIEDFLPAGFVLQLAELRLMPLYELLEKLYVLFDLKEIGQQDAYLCAFYDAVTEYMQNHSSELTAFIAYWDETLYEKTIPSGEIEGIRILSIHKSKGLEYHTVLVPFCDWKMENETNNHLIWCALEGQGPEYDQPPFNELSIAPINYSTAMAESVYCKSYLEERLQLWVDNMNLLYVAFTRACKNLIVWGKKGQTGTVSELLGNTMEAMELEGMTCSGLTEPAADAKGKGKTKDKEKEENPEPVVYEYGCLCPSEEVRKKVTGNPLSEIPEGVPVCIESLETDIEFKQSNRSADFIRGDEEEENRERYIRQGQLLHQVFASIRTAADLEKAVARLRFEGIIESEKQEKEIIRLAERALEHPEVQEWYDGSWRLYNECGIIYTDDQGGLQTRRPDRVMMREDEVVIVDFKFGRKKAEYREQVKEYMHLLTEMGYGKVKGYLWYVFANELEAIG